MAEVEEERVPGRPKGPTVPVRFRIPMHIYDDYARIASSLGIPVADLFREILTIHRPRQDRTDTTL